MGKKGKPSVNPTIHVFGKRKFVVEPRVHAPTLTDEGYVEFISDVSCTLYFKSDQLFGADQLDLDPGTNRFAVQYDDPTNAVAFAYDFQPIRRRKSKRSKRSTKGDPKDIIVP